MRKEYKYWDWCNSCASKETFERCVGCARPEDGTDEPSNYEHRGEFKAQRCLLIGMEGIQDEKGN